MINNLNAVYYDQIGVYLRVGNLLIRSSACGEDWNKMPQLTNGGEGGCGGMTNLGTHLESISAWVASDASPP